MNSTIKKIVYNYLLKNLAVTELFIFLRCFELKFRQCKGKKKWHQ